MTTNVLTYNLSGQVRHQALPVSGVVVTLNGVRQDSPGSLASANVFRKQQITGPKGEFTFPVRPGTYQIDVEPDRKTRFLKHSLSYISVLSNTTCNVNLQTGLILSGSVRTASGANVASGEVVAISIEPSSYQASAIVAESGHYALMLPRGKYHLFYRSYRSASRESVEESEIDHCLDDAFVAIVVTAGFVVNIAVDDEYDLILPELITFAGTVTDTAGQPVAAAKVSVSPSVQPEPLLPDELSLAAVAVTDGGGRFSFQLEPGVFDIVVEPAPGGLLFGSEEKQVAIKKETCGNFQLREGFRLHGHVQDGEQPLPQSLVRITGLDKKLELTTRTDWQGQFEASVPGGEFRILISAHPKHSQTVTINGVEHAGLAPWSKTVIVGGDTYVAARLQQGTALYGRICDKSGQARPGAMVSAFSAELAEKRNEHKLNGSINNAIADGEGRYCIFLPPGSYRVSVNRDFARARTVEVQNVPVNLDIEWHGWCQVRFEIGGDDGKPIPRCRVTYSPYGISESALPENRQTIEEISAEISEKFSEKFSVDQPDSAVSLPHGWLITDEDGVCQISLPAGIYAIDFNPPQKGSYESKSIRQLSISGDLTRTIRLPLKA